VSDLEQAHILGSHPVASWRICPVVLLWHVAARNSDC